MSDYWQYNFPPFFTIQPNDETRKLQMDAWCAIIMDHCRKNKIYELNISESLNAPPFRNDSIDRCLTEESLKSILDAIAERGRLEWIDVDGVKQCLIYWYKIEEWANIISKWVEERALNGTMCTLYEINGDDDRSSPELLGLDDRILLKALKHLEREGKAAVVEIDDSFGVKFL
ncbi:Vacuolar protein-sorting-associated protein 25 [Sarcoptes scabiei]|uniref:Vacuolar protein-sorting-associated protein 25 n=1 Tax=Sarcoptes scabiei TaxID=52283 RepID=A0A132A8I3_SARSC|nr:Vacuolar protein-sorting-associated protein 25 [Sarcoptes scabiei]KPM07227.1 vacuolar protein-sorting-associated protein 25-like protein [Sarcoptes scabiei]UXI16597.1 putative kinetochore protein nuf2 [Sarcoptes scabiei]